MPSLSRFSIHLCLQDLVRQLHAKSKALQDLQARLDSELAKAAGRENELAADISRANMQVRTACFEREQLEEVFQKENGMRRELEMQVEEQKKTEIE